MGVKQEEENYWKMHAKWVSRRGKIKRIARKDRTHGTKPKSHSSGNILGHQGLNGQPVCVFTETTSEKESKTFTSYEGTKVVEG